MKQEELEEWHHTVPDLRIRSAGMQDLDTLIAFNAALARETEGRDLDLTVLRRGVQSVLQADHRGFYLVAEWVLPSSSCLIGQLLITYEWSDWRNADFWWIQSVYVRPDWRRRGVYGRLHETVRTAARDRPDVCGLRLYVEHRNEAAITAYHQAGLAESTYLLFEEDFVFPTPSCGGDAPSP